MLALFIIWYFGKQRNKRKQRLTNIVPSPIHEPVSTDYRKPIFNPQTVGQGEAFAPALTATTTTPNTNPYPQANELPGNITSQVYDTGTPQRAELDAANRRTGY
jgi:hypothetical protein